MKSITFYLTLYVIKLKGLKKIFSADPIDYLRLRREDQQLPKSSFLLKHSSYPDPILDTKITVITSQIKSRKVVLYFPGGAFISGPGKHHWDTLEYLSRQAQQTIWMCNYPKAPESNIETIAANVYAVYQHALQSYAASDIILMGDSAGATLCITLIQRLIDQAEQVPSKLILLSPVVDATLPDPRVVDLDKTDPMLAVRGVQSAKRMASTDGNLAHPLLSPITRGFANFPPTTLFAGENDINFPDQERMASQLKAHHIRHRTIIGQGMPHIWPLLPVMKEARLARRQIALVLINP